MAEIVLSMNVPKFKEDNMNEALTADAAIVARLRRLDCCALSDALDQLKLGSVISGVPQRSGVGRIAGRVVTLRLGVGDPPPGPPRHLGVTAIEASGPSDIIVIEQRSGLEAGSWGGLLTLGAQMRGVTGIIADGPVRDIDEARDCGFSIFSKSTTARTARGRIVELGTNIQVMIEGVRVDPGDFVMADGSAVIFLAAETVENVLEAAETIAAKEAAMAQALRAGTPISQVMGGNYEHMLKSET